MFRARHGEPASRRTGAGKSTHWVCVLTGTHTGGLSSGTESLVFTHGARRLPTFRDFLSFPKAMRIAETKRLMTTSTIRMALARIRKQPRTGSKAITWREHRNTRGADS